MLPDSPVEGSAWVLTAIRGAEIGLVQTSMLGECCEGQLDDGNPA